MAKIDTLSGDFSDTAVWDLDSAEVVGYSDRLEIDLDSYQPFAITDVNYDLTASSVHWRMSDYVQSSGNQVSVEMRVSGSSSNMIRWQTNNATHYLRRYVSGSLTTEATYAVTGSGPWFRVREASGVVYWEDSSDGSSWTEQASWTHADAIDLTNVEFRFQTNGGSGGPTVTIDYFNGTASVTHEASSSLAATGTLASAATVTQAVHEAGGDLAASAALASSAGVVQAVHEAGGSLAAAAALSSEATVTQAVHEASASLEVSAASASAGDVDQAAHNTSGGLDLSGALSAAATVTHGSEASAPLSADLASLADVYRPAAGELTGAAALSSAGVVAKDADGDVAAAAVLASAASVVHEATSSLEATATVTGQAVSGADGQGSLTVTAALVSAGTVFQPDLPPAITVTTGRAEIEVRMSGRLLEVTG